MPHPSYPCTQHPDYNTLVWWLVHGEKNRAVCKRSLPPSWPRTPPKLLAIAVVENGLESFAFAAGTCATRSDTKGYLGSCKRVQGVRVARHSILRCLQYPYCTRTGSDVVEHRCKRLSSRSCLAGPSDAWDGLSASGPPSLNKIGTTPIRVSK